MARRPAMAVLASALVARFAALPLLAPQRATERCECLNWKLMYYSGATPCGSGREFTEADLANATAARGNGSAHDTRSMIRKAGTSTVAGQMTCHQFWQRLNSTRCVSLNVGKYQGSWCYVDPKCDALHGGGKSQSELYWKKCSKSDEKLRDYSPEELFRFSQQNDVYFGTLLKLSYPGTSTSRYQRVIVSDVQKEIPHWVMLEIKELGDSGKPYWFDTNADGDLPTVIVNGSRAYKAEAAAAADRQEEHPGTWATLTCIAGCGGA